MIQYRQITALKAEIHHEDESVYHIYRIDSNINSFAFRMCKKYRRARAAHNYNYSCNYNDADARTAGRWRRRRRWQRQWQRNDKTDGRW